MSDRFLLDTHALIWWWLEDRALSSGARQVIAISPSIVVSSVSGFEIAQKVRTGKLPAMGEPILCFGESVVEDGFAHLPVRHEHSVRAGLLKGEHRDPFDRLLAAQALIEGLSVVTRDPAFKAFGCETVW